MPQFVRQAPWGDRPGDDFLTVDQAHGRFLDWEPVKSPLVTLGIDGQPQPVETHNAVLRSDTGRQIGLVGAGYGHISNETFSRNTKLVAGNGPVIESAGTFGGGAVTWYLVNTGEAFHVGRDSSPTQPYLLFANAHDGSGKYKGKHTRIRVVCRNTLMAALAGGAEFSVRHTANGEILAEEAARIMAGAMESNKVWREWAEVMARTDFAAGQMEQLARDLLPAKDEADVPTITKKNRERLVELFDEGDAHEAIRGTAWAAVNAVSQWTDHERRSRGVDDQAKRENRLQSIWFGQSAAMKERAVRLVTEVALATVPAGPAGRVA